jgi:hypothetical protein
MNRKRLADIGFLIVWILLVVVSLQTLNLGREDNWSKQMGIRMSLGFKGHLTSPLIACQLAASPADLADVFNRKPNQAENRFRQLDLIGKEGKDGKKVYEENPLITAARNDASLLIKLLEADYKFIACYVPLMCLFAFELFYRRRSQRSPLLMYGVFIAVALTAVADLAENHYTLKSLKPITKDAAPLTPPPVAPPADPAAKLKADEAVQLDAARAAQLDAGVIKKTRFWSLTKWWLFSPMILVLAWGSARLGGLLASITALLLAGGGVTLIWGLVTFGRYAGLIQVGFGVVCLGALLTVGVVMAKPRESSE